MTQQIATTDLQTRYFTSALEHTLIVDRPNGETLYLAINHSKALVPPTTVSVMYTSSDPTIPVEHGTEVLAGSDEVTLTVLSDDEECARELINLSFQEARALRDLLNRPEVLAVIDPQECECCGEKGAIARPGATSKFCESCFEELSR